MNNEEFTKSLEFVLRWEGGWSSDQKQSTQSRMRGITQTEYDEYRLSQNKPKQTVKLISQDDLNDIYFNKHWILGKCQDLSFPLSMVHFDCVVNDNISSANILLQNSKYNFLEYINLRKLMYWGKFESSEIDEHSFRANVARCNDLQLICTNRE